MRHSNAIKDRDLRTNEGEVASLTSRGASHAGFGQDMLRSDLPMEALSTV
jgi:hypothetical protein